MKTIHRIAMLVAFGLTSVAANAQFGEGNWTSIRMHRGVHVGLSVAHTPAGPRAIMCARRDDGTTLTVPAGAGELIPITSATEKELKIEALGASFVFRRSRHGLAHVVYRNGKPRPGHHSLEARPTTPCRPDFIEPAKTGTKPLNGAWRGVYGAPEGPAAEIVIRAKAGETKGLVCLANGNGSIVYWTFKSVGAVALGENAVHWKREAVPAGRKTRTTYALRRATDADLLRMQITNAKTQVITLHRGLSDRGCMHALDITRKRSR